MSVSPEPFADCTVCDGTGIYAPDSTDPLTTFPCHECWQRRGGYWDKVSTEEKMMARIEELEARLEVAGRMQAVAEGHCESLEHECDRLIAANKAVVKAAQAMKDKLEKIHDDSGFNAVWTMALIHGMEYKGPTYQHEFAALCKALDEVNK